MIYGTPIKTSRRNVNNVLKLIDKRDVCGFRRPKIFRFFRKQYQTKTTTVFYRWLKILYHQTERGIDRPLNLS